jgi:hypothetical protein
MSSEKTMENKNSNLVYCPRAVAYTGTVNAWEGGGGTYVTAEEAVALGATDIKIGFDGYGWANWPQRYWFGEPVE